MKLHIFLIFLSFTFTQTYAQDENIQYYGAGNTEGITISSSTPSNQTNAMNTINGSGMEAKRMEATRLLAQATLGYEDHHIDDVLELGIEAWVDEQMEEPISYLSPWLFPIQERRVNNFYNHVDREVTDSDIFELSYPRYTAYDYSWWHVNMNNEDLLRQRVAFSLSQLFVISADSELINQVEGLSDFYDMLSEHSFGNFRELMQEVSLHPSMGFYLSHLNNPKSDPTNNTFPDENYAREIMQLFTIGLYELNQDGSRKLNENGNFIPSYGQSDIKGLAKVFTGLGGSDFGGEFIKYFEDNNIPLPEIGFGRDLYSISHREPMKMYENWHEKGEKHILRNHVIPSGQTGMQDINMALDILFHHENVAPFIGKRLIQFLVKSNPSPEYIARISGVFIDNGQGERGDMSAVVKAILMDEEARSCEWQQDPSSGKLKEPFVRVINILRSIEKTENELGYYSNTYESMKFLKQSPLFSPTVFNFYKPDYQPVGPLADQNLIGPEFQIHNSQTSIGYFNVVHSKFIWEIFAASSEEFPDDWELKVIRPVLGKFDQYNDDFESLINYLDVFYVHGRLSDRTRNIIREAINPMKNWDYMYRSHIKTALNLILVSPDYAILK